MRHYARELLPEEFRVPAPVGVVSRNTSTWTRGVNDSWTYVDPPEDLAVAPGLDWTERHRELIEQTFLAARAGFLEPGQRYAVTWPPYAALATPGEAFTTDGETCSLHDVDYREDCEECSNLERPREIVEPAVWDWYVTVETYQDLDGGSESLEATEEFLFLSTELDPREIAFRENPDGA